MNEFFIKPTIILAITIAAIYIFAKMMQKSSALIFKTSVGKNKDTKLLSLFYIDNANKVISIEHHKKKYLMLISKNQNNILLDKDEVQD